MHRCVSDAEIGRNRHLWEGCFQPDSNDGRMMDGVFDVVEQFPKKCGRYGHIGFGIGRVGSLELKRPVAIALFEQRRHLSHRIDGNLRICFERQLPNPAVIIDVAGFIAC